jgi:hypothetical protein
VTIGLFETIETIGQALARSLTSLMDKYGSKKKNCLCQKLTLNAMIFTQNLL